MRLLACFGLGLGIVVGCSNPGYFVCTDDNECTEAEGGRCEPSGACSFPDASCPTGRRYGEAGNPNIAGQCVPPEDIGDTDPTLGSASGSGSDSTTGSDPTTGADGSTTVGASADGSSTGPGTTGSSATDTGLATTSDTGDSSGSTGDPGPDPDMFQPCQRTIDCMSGTCAYFVEPGTLDPLGNFCSDIGCDDPSVDCLDIGTDAPPICVEIPVNGVLESICALDCSDAGASGCADEMICLNNIVGLPGMCAHPK